MKQKVVALLQARTDSSRLPKKVLKNILGKPMILHQLQRTLNSRYLDQLMLVTSDEKSDDTLAQIVMDAGFKVFRGSKNDVLERFEHAVEYLGLNEHDIVVRLTGDCPLHDAAIIDESIEAFMDSRCDYLANCVEPVYPDGLDVEVFSVKSLQRAYKNATLPSQREHVTPFIRESGLFNVCHLEKEPRYQHWRLTVDESKDFELIQNIYEHFGKTCFSFDEIVLYLQEKQNLLKINSNIKRNEGYIKSLKEDANDN